MHPKSIYDYYKELCYYYFMFDIIQQDLYEEVIHKPLIYIYGNCVVKKTLLFGKPQKRTVNIQCVLSEQVYTAMLWGFYAENRHTFSLLLRTTHKPLNNGNIYMK